MDVPFTLLIFIESTIVSILLGASTIAVLSYALSLKYGYPREGFGNIFIHWIYTLIRVLHIFLAILVALSLFIFGVLDGSLTAQVEYGIKAAILFFNGGIAYGMAHGRIPVPYGAPGIAAGWYFLAAYHTFSLSFILTSIVTPILWYLLLFVAFQVVFILFRQYIKPQHL